MSKIIENRWLPLKGFSAINLFGLVFVRKGTRLDRYEINHERIHSRQQLEMLILPFYLWYVVEWLLLLAKYRDAKKAYYSISFEREAYAHMRELDYLDKRRPYAWIKRVLK